jgi:periplasmic protein CpxP/Spy
MKSAQKLFAAALLASLGLAASAQTPTVPQAGAGTPPAAGESRARYDPARRQERMTQRLADLKQKLQITPTQESAWTAYTNALQPTQMQRPHRDEFAQLTTPERIDRMRQLRTQRMAEMDQRGEATKGFYATLTPEQKKVFDAQTLRGAWGGGGDQHHHRHHS